MARTVKPEAVASKRKEILDATQRLVLTKGYDQISIQDILDEVQMSSGAFHHYFDSRRALLEAFIARIKHELEEPLLPLINDPQLSAIEKLQGFFDTLDRLRTANRADVVKLLHVWYSDDNAIVRLHVDEAILEQRVPLLTAIIRQGIREATFATAHPDSAGELLQSLLHGMENTHAKLLLSLDHAGDRQRCITRIVATHAAYMDAVERILGVAPNSFSRTDTEAVNVWVTAIQGNDHA